MELIIIKYAIISDIHGNLPAFEAVLKDAGAQGAEQYLLIGDYTSGFPWGNEAVNIIRGLAPAAVIRGNGEEYLINLQKENRIDYSLEQFKPVYWAFRRLSPENLDYLANLPERIAISDDNGEIYLSHFSSVFYRSPRINYFHSSLVRIMRTAAPFSQDEYTIRARKALYACSEALADIRALPKGIYLFGHNHMQFHMEYGGRLFINPGSCGEPLDWDTTAPYTLLEYIKNGWAVTERRVSYDLNAVSEGLDKSGFTAYAPVWSGIMKLELTTGRDYFYPFVMHLIETGRKLGQTEYPVNNEVWDKAVHTWEAENFK